MYFDNGTPSAKSRQRGARNYCTFTSGGRSKGSNAWAIIGPEHLVTCGKVAVTKRDHTETEVEVKRIGELTRYGRIGYLD